MTLFTKRRPSDRFERVAPQRHVACLALGRILRRDGRPVQRRSPGQALALLPVLRELPPLTFPSASAAPAPCYARAWTSPPKNKTASCWPSSPKAKSCDCACKPRWKACRSRPSLITSSASFLTWAKPPRLKACPSTPRWRQALLCPWCCGWCGAPTNASTTNCAKAESDAPHV
jgi:hypothetical protein